MKNKTLSLRIKLFLRHYGYLLGIISLLNIGEFNALSQYPSDSAQVSLLTASRGNDPSSAFGHSAIRIHDASHGYDQVYGYGTYDFNTPHFYLKFTTGKLMYSLSRQPFDLFYETYQEEGQALYEQKFNLTNKEKWTLISNLEKNHQPENKYYRYDFFYDNCATRIRDIIGKSVDGKLNYDSSFIKKPESFRHLIRPNYNNVPWLNFGIDLLFGPNTDHIATLCGYMFLPENIMQIYSKTTIVKDTSVTQLTQQPKELFPSRLTFIKPSLFSLPLFSFFILLILILLISVIGYRKKHYQRWIDVTFFILTGSLGSLILFMMTTSMHVEVWYNFNLIWINPLGLIIAIATLVRCNARWFQLLVWFYLGLSILFIPISFLIPQEIPVAVYPIIGVIITRCVTILKENTHSLTGQ